MGTPPENLKRAASTGRYIAAMVFALVLGSSALVSVGATAARSVSPIAVSRVELRPAVPIPADAVKAGPSPDCPQMVNPGGGLHWKPSTDPGPIPTNGTVQLTRLGVNAPIVKVGIDSNETMVVPRNAHQVAWLDQGSLPGRTQNIVLAGHIAYSHVTGSFFHLDELKVGDDITLALEGKDLHFRVVWNCSFARDTTYAEQIMGYTTMPSLTLISCGGDFDSSAGTHTRRIAVRAELVTT